MKNAKELKILSITIACWGILFIICGTILNSQKTTITETDYKLDISKNKVAASKTNEIKLKDMKSEINTPLSVDIKDYLEDINNLDASVLKALKLDTSGVNVQEAGNYTYTISYKRKKYNGSFIIVEKELPKLNLTLKNLTLNKDTVLDNNLSTYIVEPLTEEIAKNITLDLSQVKTNIEGTYQYSIIYNNNLYTANIEIITPQNIQKNPDESKNEETTTTPSDEEEEKNTDTEQK